MQKLGSQNGAVCLSGSEQRAGGRRGHEDDQALAGLDHRPGPWHQALGVRGEPGVGEEGRQSLASPLWENTVAGSC